MIELTNKTVSIIGAAKSGLATARFVLKMGGRVRISDMAPLAKFEHVLEELAEHPEVKVEAGGHTREFITQADLLVLSPGIRPDSLVVQWAKAAEMDIMNEIELASHFCDKPIIAVTGSNGKTTTVTLISLMIEAAGKKACLCGNIGNPFISEVLNLEEVDYVVLEVSSFQLEWIKTFKPYIAIFLNFSQNHLDRHKDLDEYFQAKVRLFMNQTEDDYAILNACDERMSLLQPAMLPKVSFFNSPEKLDRHTNPNCLVMVEIASILQIDQVVCEQVFNDFKGVEHRMEVVRHVGKIVFINDSKSTTVEAGRWAVERSQSPLVLICGGRDKGLDFTVLQGLIRERVESVIVFGEAAEKIACALEGCADLVFAAGLSEAVHIAHNISKPCGTVLFSPMCASFDMFDNFEHRGREFKRIVHSLLEKPF